VPALALWLWSLFGLLAIGLRVAIHFRRTGDSGLRGLTGKPGSIEWFAGLGFVVAIAVGVLAAELAQNDKVNPVDALDTAFVHALGMVFYAVGLTGVLIAQGTMGGSWRVGVDPGERTALVTAGPFAIVRNPIYTAMIATILGLTLLVPSVLAFASMALLLLSLELQTRVVEEPYLLRTHGERYTAYAVRVGRFLPGVGRLTPASSGGESSTATTHGSPSRGGTVFIAEEMAMWPDVDVADLVRRGVDLRTLEPGDIECFTGRFFAHWQSDDHQQYRNGPEAVSVDEAIAWGRSQADVVLVRVGNGDLGGDEHGYFSAGTRHPEPDIPPWPGNGINVTARPYRGPWKVWSDGYEIGGPEETDRQTDR
jgi:protein-S-isoprenylcysteine O-methyltransferase Ste14